MQTYILAAITFPIIIVLDLLWIGVVGGGFYESQLGSMLRPDVLWMAAVPFYAIYSFALSYFVLTPALTVQSLPKAVLTGALLGLTAYAAYNFSNLATLANWPLALTFVDLAWGVVSTACTAGMAYGIARKALRY